MSEIDIVFAMLRAAVGGENRLSEADVLTAGQWWRIFRLLQQNHVAALCCTIAVEAQVPREVLLPWLAEKAKAEVWQKHQRAVEAEIGNTMWKHGIEMKVLKGTHAAEWWPNPELREFGDIDLYFYDRHAEADRVAERELGVVVKRDSHHHTKYDYRGVTIESHFDFLNRHYPRSNGRYEKRLKECVGEVAFEPLFLLRHMAGHFAAGRITLRDLCDWVFMWHSLASRGVDEQMCMQMAEEYGMSTFVAALHTIAEQRLGMRVPGWESMTSGAIVRRVEQDIVYGSPKAVEHQGDGVGRLAWKMERWNAMHWKRRMVYSDSELSLLIASITSHAEKPRSILHKM